MRESVRKLIHLIRCFWTLSPIVIGLSSPGLANQFLTQANHQAEPVIWLCWLANLRKVPPLRNLTIKLVCLPLLFHPFNLRCCLFIYPQYWRGPPGQKLMWFQSQKKRRTPVLSSVQAPWSSIKRERTHAAHGCRFKGIYLQTTAATLMTEQEGSQLAS